MSQKDNEGRKRGIFTEADRKWIRGERELSEGSEFNTRRRIRERYTDALKDFEVLLENWERLPDRDRKEMDAGNPDAALAHLLGGLLFPTEDEEMRKEVVKSKKPGQYASQGDRILFTALLLGKQVNRAASVRGDTRQYSVDISAQEQDPRSVMELKNQVRRGEISVDDVVELRSEGVISEDKFVRVSTVFGDVDE